MPNLAPAVHPAGVPPRKSTALSISPIYGQLLAEVDSDVINTSQEAQAIAEKNRKAKKLVTVRFWFKVLILAAPSTISLNCDQNDAGVVIACNHNVFAPQFPHFLPSHSEELVGKYHIDVEACEYWVSGSETWVYCCKDSFPHNVKNHALLEYRVPVGLASVSGMPGWTEPPADHGRE